MTRLSTTQSCRSTAQGFTLIELLVVVAIIAILIAILMPSLNKAREQSRAVACASNMRQLGIAMTSYANEYNGLLPYGARTGNPDQLHKICWDDLISFNLGANFYEWSDNPYGFGWGGYKWVSPIKALTCPSDNVDRERTEYGRWKRSYSVPIMDIAGIGNGHSDTMFCSQVNMVTPGVNFRSFKLTEAVNQSGTLLLVEHPSTTNYQGSEQGMVYCNSTKWQYTDQVTGVQIVPDGIHAGGKWNYLYVDSHVELIPSRATWGHAVHSPENYSRGAWTRDPDD